MRRILDLIVRNWPLKLAAIALATFLYAGLVLSQSAQVWPGSVPIVPSNLPTSAVLLGTLPAVTDIRYFAPSDVAEHITGSSFIATVDLAQAQVEPGHPCVVSKVDVTATDPRVTILDYDPPSICVQLDPLVTKQVPVVVDHGAVPPDLQISDPILSTNEAVVSGPESIVRLVNATEARVVIQPSGIDVDESVDLVAVDAQGNDLESVDIEPSSVHVKIAVGSGFETKSLPLNPVVAGTPATGFEIGSVTVNPIVVSVQGDADALAGMAKVDTAPISVSGANANISREVALVLPEGVSSISGDSVKVTITLDPIAATRVYSAGVVLSGARDDRTYTLSTGSVLVTLGGAVAALDALDPASFNVVADVDGLGPGTHKVKLRASLPADVTLVAMSPPEVSVTVVENATPSPSTSP